MRLAIGVVQHRHTELQVRSVGYRGQRKRCGIEVVVEIGQLRGRPVEDELELDEVPRFLVAGLFEGCGHLKVSVSAHIDDPSGPRALEVRIAPLHDRVPRKRGLEIVGGAAERDAPLGLRGGVVQRSIVSVAEEGLVSEGLLPDDLRTDALTTEVGEGTIGVDVTQRQGIAVITGIPEEYTGTVIVRCRRVVVARRRILATGDFRVVADTVSVKVGRAISVADAEGIILTDAIVDIITDAVCVRVRGTGAVAHTERVILAHAVVHIVADAIGIGICGTAATAHADGVELVAVAITVAGWNARTVAYTALIEGAYAGVDIVTDAVSVAVARAIAATYADGINDVAVAVAIPGGDVRASTFVNRTWSIANATGVHGADAIVDIIADAIRIGIRRAIATAHAEGIGLVAIAVAVACRNVGTATFKDGTGSAADTTGVERGARSVIDGGIGVEVAGRSVRASRDVRRFDAEVGHVRTDEFTT